MTEPDADPTHDRPTADPDPVAPLDDSPSDATLARAPRGRSRRAPRYAPFVTTGALVGLVAAVVLVLALPPVDQLGTWSAFGYLALLLGLVGGLVGAAVAVVLDRRGR